MGFFNPKENLSEAGRVTNERGAKALWEAAPAGSRKIPLKLANSERTDH